MFLWIYFGQDNEQNIYCMCGTGYGMARYIIVLDEYTKGYVIVIM